MVKISKALNHLVLGDTMMMMIMMIMMMMMMMVNKKPHQGAYVDQWEGSKGHL